MWDCQREYSNTGRNANILKQWYRKYKARGDRVKLHDRIARIQAVFRGTKTREFVKKKMNVLCRFQAAFRGLRGRRQWRVICRAVLTIQRHFKGNHLFRKPILVNGNRLFRQPTSEFDIWGITAHEEAKKKALAKKSSNTLQNTT